MYVFVCVCEETAGSKALWPAATLKGVHTHTHSASQNGGVNEWTFIHPHGVRCVNVEGVHAVKKGDLRRSCHAEWKRSGSCYDPPGGGRR